MKIIDNFLNDVKIIEPSVYSDKRGYFFESWNQQVFNDLLKKDIEFVQDNHSGSVHGTLRGLHYQLENSQGKLVRVTKGEVFDVAVNLRSSSNDFGKIAYTILSSENKRMFWIPEGYAHGFLVLSDYAEFQYKTTNFYDKNSDRTIIWNDKTLNITWPLDRLKHTPLLSEKDILGKKFEDAEVFD